jgi:hypothetical protein
MACDALTIRKSRTCPASATPSRNAGPAARPTTRPSGPTHTFESHKPAAEIDAGACGEVQVDLVCNGEQEGPIDGYALGKDAHSSVQSPSTSLSLGLGSCRPLRGTFETRSGDFDQGIAEHEAQRCAHRLERKLVNNANRWLQHNPYRRANRSRTLSTAIADHLAPERASSA